MKNNISISIVIPAYNEIKRIAKTLLIINNYMTKHFSNFEIIVVDDGSTDNTKSESSKLKLTNLHYIRYNQNKGKGFAIKQGISFSNKELVLITDSDLSTDIESLDKILSYINHYDVVIGSRKMPNSKIMVKQPFFRSTLGKIFPFFVRLLILNSIRDTQCGFKLFKTDVAKDIITEQTINRFCFDVELLCIALAKGYTVKEVGISWYNSNQSKVRIFRDSFNMFKDLIKIKIRKMCGKYGL